MRIESKAVLLALLASILALTSSFGLGRLVATGSHTEKSKEFLSHSAHDPNSSVLQEQIQHGRYLFSRNCAHCHGDDARGDEGPTLFALVLSDARIAQKINTGIKGEMPRFSGKLGEADIAALISYLRTLKD
jgi:mono/diheme cytochrome c family protein